VEIYLIRHTPPDISNGICYGQTNVPLHENFIDESEKIIRSIPQHIDAIYSSPLSRCKILAEKIILYTKQKPELIIDERIIEMNFGKWEMKSWDDINRKEFDAWAENILTQKTPDGESFSDMNERVNDFVDELLNEKNKTAVIITHAGVIRCFLSRFGNIPLKETLKISVDFSSVNFIKTL
jgi:alpha-ribazole phosphatase